MMTFASSATAANGRSPLITCRGHQRRRWHMHITHLQDYASICPDVARPRETCAVAEQLGRHPAIRARRRRTAGRVLGQDGGDAKVGQTRDPVVGDQDVRLRRASV